MCCALSSSTCPELCGAFPESARAIATPCCTSRFAIVRTSARSGRLARTSGSADKRLAAISGSAAFFAPPIGIVPASGAPPRMRILCITVAPDAGCLYGRERQRSSRRLIGGRIRRGLGGGRRLAASLLLAPVQIIAQGAGEALVAFGMFVALGAGQSRRIGHHRDGRGGPRRCQSLLDAQADLDRKDDRDGLFRGIFRRLVGMGAAPCIDSRAIAI